MANGLGSGFSSPAVDALGLGAALSDQVKGETDEERKKRLMAMSGSPLGNYSPAASMLLGARGGGLGGV